MLNVWAVVPVKTPHTAKRRLAPLLTPAERAALAEAMLTDVLGALRDCAAVARVLVVSPDPRALALAERLGARALADPPAAEGTAPDDDSALNAAVDSAAALAAREGADGLLAVPADLPLVAPGAIAAVLAAPPPPPSVVLVPTTDGGTGALLRTPPLAVPARFGPGSVGAHLAAAATHGVRARLLWEPRLAIDCDRPADLQRLAALRGDGRALRLLATWRIAERVPRAPAFALAAHGEPGHD